MKQTTAQTLNGEFHVVHAVPGRVRVRSIDSQAISLDTVAQQLRQQDGICEVQTNPTTNSLVVTYHEEHLSLPEAIEALQPRERSPEALQKIQPQPELNLDAFWKELTELSSGQIAKSIIPLVTGLLVTGALGIQGLMAFPVYMITAKLTREIIKQLMSELWAQEQESTETRVHPKVAQTVLRRDKGDKEDKGDKGDSTETKKDICKNGMLPETQEQESARSPFASIQNLFGLRLSPEVNSSSPQSQSNIQNQDDVAYQIVHEIPGRIRFRVPRLATDPDYVHRLTVLTQADTKVTDVRVNTAAASVALSYDIGLISDEKMQSRSMENARSHLIELIQTASKADILINLKTASKAEEPEEETNYWSALALPTLSATLALLGGPFGLPIPPVLIGGTIAITAIPVAQRAIDGILNEGKLTIDFLDLAAITITTLQGQFISPAIMIFLVEMGEMIREQTAKSSKLQTLDLLDSLKQFVWVERNGEKQEISIHDVKKGDIVIVYPGDQIPVDGHIIRGKALIDEQKLTGESMPVMRRKGHAVYTSTLVREGQLYILTDKVGAETRAGQIIKIMQDAPVHDTRIENYAANIANQAVVPTLILSGIVLALTGNFGRAASILTLDFATGIRVSVPTTVLAALTYAARRGILIRSGRALEKLAQVDVVVFDKTGTLTQGEPIVVSVETVSPAISPLRVITLAAAAEQRLTHPVAVAIVNHAQKQGAEILPRGKWDYHIGLGVRAEIDGQTVLVGSDRFLQEEGVSLEPLHRQQQRLQIGCNSLIYVASNGELLGVIAYRDPLRPESRGVIKALRNTEKMDIHMLTGDKKQTAIAVAGELGIENEYTHAEAFPEEKVAVVKDLHNRGMTVAFVGDGINDSPALAYADVSVSFANGSDVARETADVVLMENNLRGLPEAVAIARQSMELIHQNTGIVAIPNLGALILAVAVGIDPLAATLVNNGSTVIAGLNGLRPLLTDSEEADQLAATLDTDDREQNSDRFPSIEDLEPAMTQPVTPEISSDVSQSLELIADHSHIVRSESLNGFKHYHVKHGSRNLNAEPLTGVALANRLNVSATTISRRKSKPDFPQWASSLDPEGITWAYSQKSKLFMAG
jgi:Cu2+-exporting ATPase